MSGAERMIVPFSRVGRPVVPWTGREVKILRDLYPTQGLEAVVPLLPKRTPRAIEQYARCKLGLKPPGGPRKKREPWTTNEHIDEAIRRAYQGDVTSGTISRLETRIGRPRQWIRKRAEQLGYVTPRFKEPEWTPEEDAIVQENAHKHIDRIAKALRAKGYQRTACGVRTRLYTLSAERFDPDHYTASEVARLMGVNSKTPTAWIEKGLLKAKRKKTEQPQIYDGSRVWLIHRKHLRRFIVEHPAHVDLRRADKYWLIDLLAGQFA